MTTRFFGQFLLSQGRITAPQLLAAVEYQQRHNPRLGDLAVELGLLTAYDAQRINALQAREDLLFGEAAIKLELLRSSDLTRILVAQRDLHVQLGQALAHLGYMSRATVAEAVDDFMQQQGARDDGLPALPDDTPEPALASALFPLAHRLLSRSWGLHNKADDPQRFEGAVFLSDRNAVAPLHADGSPAVVVGAPHAAAVAAARPYAGDSTPADDLVEDMVSQLATVLAENLTSVMAEQGHKLAPQPARTVDAQLPRPPGARAVLVPYQTPHGKVLVGLLA